ncbi:hypothetical protein D3C79_636250 [compost metagenome]
MAGAGQQFLAGTRFALDQQRCIQRRHAPCFADHGRHHPGTLEDAVETAQFLLAHVVDTFTDTVGPVQGQHRASQRFAVVMLGLQRRDVGQKHVALDLDPQAIDPRLVGAHQLGQVEVFDIARQRHAWHLIDAHPEQLRRRAVGGNDTAAHVDRQDRELKGAEQCIELHVPPLAGHQPHALDPEHSGNRLEFRAQGLELQVDQVRAVQVDGIAMIPSHLAPQDVDAVFDQQVEDVAKNANAVLAMHFDTHEGSRSVEVFQRRTEKS